MRNGRNLILLATLFACSAVAQTSAGRRAIEAFIPRAMQAW
jgi:hypothetical protein